MPLKKLSFIVSLFFMQTIVAGDFLSGSPSKKCNIESIIKKKELNASLLNFYDDLYDALIHYFINRNKEQLKHITGRSHIIHNICKLLKKIKKFELGEENTIKIIHPLLGEFEFTLFKFINYLLFISKITDAILPQNQREKNLAIFADDVFSHRLLIFLLASYLNLSGYKSIMLNILTKSPLDYENLIRVINYYGIELTINQYQTADDLINSQNKIDVYLSNLSFPTEQHYFKCLRKKKIDEIQSVSYQLFVTLSDKADTSIIISTKMQEKRTKDLRNYVINELLKELRNPEGNINKTEINNYTCILKPSKEVTLANLIYLTSRTQGKQSIPLFVSCYFKKDTKSGIIAQHIIMENQIVDFNNYNEILCSIFKTNIGLIKADVENHATQLQPYIYHHETNKILPYKASLNDISSTISTFIRNTKILAPSIINIL